MKTTTPSRTLDKAGAWLGAVCALHCGLTPVVIAATPALALCWASVEPLHVPAVGALTLMAVLSAWLGQKRHKRYYAWFFVGPGLSLMWAGMLPGMEVGGTWALASGGTLVVAGHLLNLKLAHGHIHDSQCRHRH